MTSQKQAEANRRNAEKSTGPRTPQGKTTAAANSTTHGATATIYRPIRHENPADHHAIRAGLIETWNPQTPQEYQLIEMAASAYIRLQRVEAWETSLLTANMEATQKRNNLPFTPTPEDDLGCALAFTNPTSDRALEHMNRYRRTATSDYHRAIESLRRQCREREEAPIRQYRAFEAEEKYRKATTAAPKIPANQEGGQTPRSAAVPQNRQHSPKMASFREPTNLHIIPQPAIE